MSARTTCTSALWAARVAAVVLIGIGVAAAAVAPSEGLGLPDPTSSLAEPLTPVTDVTDQLLEPVTGAPAPALPPSSGGSPSSPSPGESRGSNAPAPSGGQPGAQSSPRTAEPAGRDAVAVDADIDGLLGLCVRVPSDGGRPSADLTVLDRDLIAVLSMAGVPLRAIVQPCPAGLVAPTRSTSGATGGASATQAAQALAADPTTTGRLAFTGADIVPTAVLAAGLLWLGVLFTIASRRLALARRAG